MSRLLRVIVFETSLDGEHESSQDLNLNDVSKNADDLITLTTFGCFYIPWSAQKKVRSSVVAVLSIVLVTPQAKR